MQPMVTATTVLCIQVSAIAVVGVLAMSLSRQDSAKARWIAYSTTIMIAMFSILILFPTPKLHLATTPSRQAEKLSPLHLGLEYSKAASVAKDASGLSPSVDILQVLNRAVQTMRTMEARQESSLWGPAIAIFWSLSLVGLLRFLASFAYSQRLIKHSEPISDAQLQQLHGELRKHMHSVGKLEIRQSEGLNDAAVVGVLRPVILLPAQWRSWTPTQLRCVLAHELAHASRCDSIWRMASCSVATIHFYNPFVHILARKLAFLQEVAADQLAAKIVGPRRYLRGLSSLALEQDRRGLFHDAGMNPVFSGFLIRRIEMLQNVCKWQVASEPLWHRGLAAGFVFLLGGLLASANAIAQVSDETQKAGSQSNSAVTRIARLDASTKRAGSTAADPTAGMFTRALSDPNMIPVNDVGMFKLQVSDALQAWDMNSLIGVINPVARQYLKTEFKSEEMPTFDAANIQRIVASLRVLHGYNPNAEEGHKHTLSLASDAMEFELVNSVDISAWVKQFAPGSMQDNLPEGTVFTLPRLAALGPFPPKIAQKSPTTLCFGGFTDSSRAGGDPSQDVDTEAIIQHNTAENEASWADTFRASDGGILTAAAFAEELAESMDAAAQKNGESADDSSGGKAGEIAFRKIARALRTIGLGVDVSADGKKLGVRLYMTCTDETLAASVEENIAVLLGAARTNLESQIELDSNAAMKLPNVMSRQLLDSVVVQRITCADGQQAICVRAACDNPKLTGAEITKLLLPEGL